MDRFFWFLILLVNFNFCQAAVLTFEDAETNYTEVVPNGYGNFTWDNMGYVDISQLLYPTSGYHNGVQSGNKVAFNSSGEPATITHSTFTFNGAYFTAAWNDGLTVKALGYKNGNLLFEKSITVNTDDAHYFDFNFVNIDTLNLSSFGGVLNPTYTPFLSGNHTQFAMDDFNFTANAETPIPSAAWLFGTALIGLLGLNSRRKIFSI